METFLIKALQLILSLSILVIIHEFGHFLFARLFKVRVEKFYLFFDPWFALFRYKPKNSETEYGVGWLPLGGYCKISGMIDESMDKEQMAQPPQPYEFRSKSSWQRLLIMVGGVLFNFLLALFIYSMVLFAWGDKYLPLENMKMGMDYSDTFKNVGFQDGDILLKADTMKLERFGTDALRAVATARQVTVLREGVETVIAIPEDMMQRFLRDKQGFAGIRFPMIIDRMAEETSPAALAGLQPGDRILSIGDVKTPTYYDASEQLDASKGKNIQVGFSRNGVEQFAQVQLDSLGKLGIYPSSPNAIYETVTITYSFFKSFPAGIRLGINTLKGYVNDMKYAFTKEGASSLGGFGAIGSLFPAQWDWRSFWMTTAFLSIILAFMNILPIPALDGGHVMFLLYEVITRRKPSDKFLEYAQVVGMLLLFGLLIYANGNDLFRFIFK
ncbi:regulator of sigma E protease [Parabacteroides sp. PF5-5]|uniref:RIP metalloprotease RseP n=1 Tax=unclassified Parabacteroides TaxID=2649774 RepID=UPI002475013A|nr:MULTISPECIES: RIP metalloprotease RseP [unclassified Parabacteroides]MDH6306936.1 regulator of sigma E protease [Parabacteroides sp. PH5-39]MDH6317803.1 regulator of sigma E protease [Parabacteroides sp. PF5-13]MDH6321541.1 regulator of sigma E protease [Parabacteroides sp. PH5-13]MDH6325323.1 regulator of sigma E protease [Parabacteroides sp. PH5-8]MDH6328994.1 regulator of sigma E protease [Parabacteroides sp. PH5-41]